MTWAGRLPILLGLIAVAAVLHGCRTTEGTSDPGGTPAGAPDATASGTLPVSPETAGESEPEAAMAPPQSKLDKTELDRKMDEWRQLHPEEEEDEDLREAVAGGAAPGPRASVFGPIGPRAVYSILRLLTGGSDPEARGDNERGVVTASYLGMAVDFTYFAASGDTPGPRLSLPGASADRARFAVEGTMPQAVLRRMAAAGGATPPPDMSTAERSVTIDGEGVALSGTLASVRRRIEESSGSSLNVVPQDDPGTVVYQDAGDLRQFLWLQDVPGTDTVQATLVTVTALPEPLERALAILAEE